MESPPKTGSEAFEAVKIPEEHPTDGDLHDHQPSTMAFGLDPADGLPRMQTGPWGDKLAPPLDPDTLVCMEDTSAYVLRDAGGHVVATFAPAEVRLLADGRAVISRVTALARLDPPSKSGVRPLFAFALALAAVRDGTDVTLEPLRHKCAHYARQMNDFPGDLSHRMVLRLCTAKRTDNGEFESLGNSQVHACELREPRDARTEALLREFDERAVKAGRERIREHHFDVAAELRDAETDGGIFKQ